jgi:alpha-ketoglutarate-dependent taurine dioxygenase
MPKLIKPASEQEVPTIIPEDSRDELALVDRELVVNQFKTHGVVLFRSFPLGIDRFQACVKAYSSSRLSYPGSQRSNRKNVSQDGIVQRVAGGTGALPLHSELAHTPFRPDVCWFYCVKAPEMGSETTLCDGLLLLSALSKPTIRRLEHRRLRYRRRVPLSFWRNLLGIRSTCEVRDFLRTSPKGQFFKMQDSDIYQDFVTPCLHIAKFLNARVFANNMLYNFRKGHELRYPTFGNMVSIPNDLILEVSSVARRCTIDVRWHDADLLMFDNTRFMHGRRAVLDRQRTIWTQFSDAHF